MNRVDRIDMGHSIFRRLLNLAREQKEDFNLLLTRYGNERFLYRLSISQYKKHFILKGASLFLVWQDRGYRATRDIDLHGSELGSTEQVKEIFRSICAIQFDDGISFQPDTIKVIPIREDQAYGGVRITFKGVLHEARISLQVDIGFGDSISPEPEEFVYPTLLDVPAPRLLGYSKYTMIAEKLESILRLGMSNSRMKDFCDIWVLSHLYHFDGSILTEAVRGTLSRRSTSMSTDLPVAFTDDFSDAPEKQAQWNAFIDRTKPVPHPADLLSTINNLKSFLMPVIEAIGEDSDPPGEWDRGSAWN